MRMRGGNFHPTVRNAKIRCQSGRGTTRKSEAMDFKVCRNLGGLRRPVGQARAMKREDGLNQCGGSGNEEAVMDVRLAALACF